MNAFIRTARTAGGRMVRGALSKAARIAPISLLRPSRGEVSPSAHYLIGEAGFPNYGDELIAREWVRYLAMVDPRTPVVLDCMCAGPAAAILHGLHPRLTVVDTVAQLCVLCRELERRDLEADGHEPEHIEDIPAEVVADRVVQALDDEGRAARYAAGIRVLNAHARDLHVIGGGYMHSRWNANLARLSAASWAQRHGKPAIVSGVGLEPLNDSDARYVGRIARAVTEFSCRDTPSRDAIDPDHICTTLAPDDCFVNGLDDAYLPDDASLPDVMVCMQTDLVDDPQALLEHMAAVLRRWEVPQGERIGVVECIPYDVLDTMDMVRRCGWEPVLFPLQDLLDQGFPARAGQRWLSTRYHPHLLAAARGCEGTFISVKPGYYDVKHDAVLRMGSRWTQTYPGQREIPLPGPGFADPSARYRYRDAIRAQAAAIYGLPARTR